MVCVARWSTFSREEKGCERCRSVSESRVASRRAVGSDLDAMNLLIRRLRVVDYSLPPREENARVGRVANEARGKTRGNCAEIFGLRAKTYLRAFWSGRFDAAVARWPRRGFSKLRALFPPHTTATFFLRRDNRCDAFYQYICCYAY